MNELQVFKNDQFGEIRTVGIDGEPWFVASDVCKALELDRTATRRLDEDEKDVRSMHTPGGDQDFTVVNEAGLYALVLGSRKPEAKAFKRWITHEVIPSIRKSGGYIAGQETMTDAELMAKALLVANRQIEERQKRIESLEQQAQLDAPKVLFASAVETAKTSILVGDLAKILKQNGVDIGQNRLFQWMRDNGWLIKEKRSDYNSPTQKGMNMGLFEVKERAINNPDGSVIVTKTTKVTGKGQLYFINLFLENRQ